jgi:hypothetical protein
MARWVIKAGKSAVKKIGILLAGSFLAASMNIDAKNESAGEDATVHSELTNIVYKDGNDIFNSAVIVHGNEVVIIDDGTAKSCVAAWIKARDMLFEPVSKSNNVKLEGLILDYQQICTPYLNH